MEPCNDVETSKFQNEVTNNVLQSSQMLATEIFSQNLFHDNKYIKYNVCGKIFEITSKYKRPIVCIGQSAFNIVCSTVNIETKEDVAIKKFKNVFDNKIDAIKTLREMKILRHLNHENVIGIEDIILPREKHSFEDVYIAYELMDYNLHNVITRAYNLSPYHYEYFLYQILRGLKYIHSANVIHRDLNPSNILVNKNCDLKIRDFGLSRGVFDNHFMTEDDVETRWYHAPELILKSSASNTSIDVWSVACIFMEMVNEEPLFPGEDSADMLRLIFELIGTPSEEDMETFSEEAKRYLRSLSPVPSQCFYETMLLVPLEAIDLMKKMLTFDPRKRISVQEAFNHPYMRSFRGLNNEPLCSVPFDFGLEEDTLSVEQIKELIYREALSFGNGSNNN